MTNPFKRLLSAIVELVRAVNSRIFFGVAFIYLAFFLLSRFPVPSEWLTLENFTILVLAQTSLFAFTENLRIDRYVRFFEVAFGYYLHFVRRYVWWTLLFFASVVFSGLLLLSADRVDALFSPVFMVFGIAIFLAVFEISSDFSFFRRLSVSPISFFATILWTVFVGVYSYRSIFSRFDLPIPGLSALVVSLVFLFAIVFFASDLRGTLVRRRLDLGHMASRRAAATFRVGQFLCIATLVAILAPVASIWYGHFSAIPAPQKTPVDTLPSDDFAPELARILTGLDKLDRTANSGNVASGVTGSSTVSSGTLSGAVPTADIHWSGTGAVSSGSLAEAPVIQPPSTPAPPAVRRIRDIFPGKRYIGLGNTGEDVLWIQRLLNREGYYSGPLDSTFGEATSAALAKFIRARARVNYDYTQLGPKAMEIFKGITVEVR
jgi:hypothetical protein